MVHLPPPVHGAAAVGTRFVERVGARLRLRVIPLRFARTIGDLGRPGIRKAAVALWCGLRQLAVLAGRRADVGYITPAGQGGALVRDAGYMLAFRLFRLPYVAHVHTMGVPAAVAALPRGLRALVRAAYAGAHRIVALNEAHARELATLVGEERVRVVPNALPELEGGARLAAAEGGDRGRPSSAADGADRILFLSNLLEAKGPFTLLEALPALRTAVPEARPTFAGGWPDPALEARFHARARELGVDDWVELTGPVSGERKWTLLREARVFVFPSTYPLECQPMVLIEAMRQGLPVVVTRHAALPEMVGDAALLVPPDDHRAVARAVLRIARDDDLAGQLGRAARRRYLDRHRIEDWEDRLVELLATAAGGASLPVPSADDRA